MKLSPHSFARRAGSALIMVLILVGVSILILAGAMNRIQSVAINNQRNNDLVMANNAAEAAVEKAYARLAYDFQSSGLGVVEKNFSSSVYQTNAPTVSENPYWSNFRFSDPSIPGSSGKIYVQHVTDYSGDLPSAYPGLFTANAPIYRIISNVVRTDSSYAVVGTAQEDILLALVPLSNYAIFYNGRLEFTQCADMIVNGSVFANGDIYVGTTASLRFNSDVGTHGTVTATLVDGLTSSYGTNWGTTFMSNPSYTTNKPSLTVSLNMTNSHFLVDIPPSGEDSMSVTGRQRLFNQAQMILIVTNSSIGGTPTVFLTMQTSLNGNVPGDDSSKVNKTYANATPASLSTNLPFLSLTNTFYDQREIKTNIVTQIDVGRYAAWIATNKVVQDKLDATSQIYPTILYVADRRKTATKQLPVVRVTQASQLPSNDGQGFTLATPDPLYTWGDYNTKISTSSSKSTSTNNPNNKVPAALLSDSLTILSSNWTDSQSFSTYSSSSSSMDAADTTINAAIVTGTMPTTGTSDTTFSGGVHNLPRLLEDWSDQNLWLNTSIVRLWDSIMATNQFRNPAGWSGVKNPYYNPPTRHYTFDTRFLDPAKMPPGIPVVLFPIRFAWTVPPPGVINYTNYTHN